MASDRRFHLAGGGIEAEVMEFGARLVCCRVPDAAGRLVDVVPGMDTAEDYRQRGGTMGAIVGRYANRIAGGTVTLGDTVHRLACNGGPHMMHGGAQNFSNTDWHGEQLDGSAVRFTLHSPDGDQGWPGNLDTRVEYRLDAQRQLSISMTAVADRDTYLNLLFHGYWNLRGHAAGSVLDHWLRVAADHYLPKGPAGVPTGEVLSVTGTPFDFRQGKAIGADFGQVPGGYGHNLCLSGHRPGRMAAAATLADPVSGRTLTIRSDQPGLQLYTANKWADMPGKEGALYGAAAAVALETQLYPNSPNTASFNPAPLYAGQVYRHRMLLDFGALRPGAAPV